MATPRLRNWLQGPCLITESEGRISIEPVRFIPLRSIMAEDFTLTVHANVGTHQRTIRKAADW